jgi:hypothetical protein
MVSKKYKLKSEVWLYPGMAGWHFISVSKKEAGEIKKKFGAKKRGWGSLPVVVTLGKTTWKTSIFPDKRSETYLLPLKAEVRIKEEIISGDKVTFSLDIRVE